MDWWQSIGNMVGFFPDTPALGVDMALHGPEANFVGYGLAHALQASSASIDVYPADADASSFDQGA